MPCDAMTTHYPTIADCIGNTPLVRLQRMPGKTSNTILVKLEGNNPAGSVKDRPALSMINRAELRGDIRPGDTLIEATSGNTGIALAMAAAIKGYRMILIMPDNSSAERKAAMTAYGAELILVSKEQGMEGARDLALQMQAEGHGKVLDQFANGDNPEAHYTSTGPEIWQQTQGSITHFVSSMGTTGTIMGVSRYLKEQNPAVQIAACSRWRAQPSPVSAAGRRSICRRSIRPNGSTASSTCPRPRPSRSCAAWPAKRASSVAYPPAVP
jgi:cysteine synthase B